MHRKVHLKSQRVPGELFRLELVKALYKKGFITVDVIECLWACLAIIMILQIAQTLPLTSQYVPFPSQSIL